MFITYLTSICWVLTNSPVTADGKVTKREHGPLADEDDILEDEIGQNI